MKTSKVLTALLLAMFIAAPAFSQPITLVAVGDSLTAGDGDDGSGGGYPARLLTLLLGDHPGSTLYNRAISGDTTTDLIAKQLDSAVADLNAAPGANRKVALVWIGSNDLFGLYASDVCTEYYPDIETCEEYEMGYSTDNVNTILSALEATGADLYIALLDDQTRRPVIADPVLRNETFPGITAEEVPRMSTQISYYNGEVETYAATYGAVTVDFYNTTIFETEATLSDDGNHPNGAGYDAIAQIWYQAVASSSPSGPEINVKGNGRDISDGDSVPSAEDHTDFGTVDINIEQATRTFVVENTGTANLYLDGSPKVAIAGAHPGDFSLVSPPSSPVAPGGSTSFQIRFDPSQEGLRQAEASIDNDDADEDPYTFAIQGTGMAFCVWEGGDDKWHNFANWPGDKVPDQTDHVLIPASPSGGYYPRIYASPGAKAASLSVAGGGVTVEAFQLAIGGQ